MDKNYFLTSIADQFDDTDPEEITMETEYKELEEWSSLIGLSILNVIAKKYGVKLSYNELVSVNTVQDLYEMVANKGE